MALAVAARATLAKQVLDSLVGTLIPSANATHDYLKVFFIDEVDDAPIANADAVDGAIKLYAPRRMGLFGKHSKDCQDAPMVWPRQSIQFFLDSLVSQDDAKTKRSAAAHTHPG
ncbi:MAG: hypothetical protein WD645_00540 [Dehalococcoidia bacterium]